MKNANDKNVPKIFLQTKVSVVLVLHWKIFCKHSSQILITCSSKSRQKVYIFLSTFKFFGCSEAFTKSPLLVTLINYTLKVFWTADFSESTVIFKKLCCVTKVSAILYFSSMQNFKIFSNLQHLFRSKPAMQVTLSEERLNMELHKMLNKWLLSCKYDFEQNL